MKAAHPKHLDGRVESDRTRVFPTGDLDLRRGDDVDVVFAHGTGEIDRYGIAQRLKTLSREVLQVGESSLYPALQRLLLNGYTDAEWGPSENNRRARFYSLTKAGRKHLAVEREEFDQIVAAIQRVLQTA